jgi:predicted nucleic acid-binding protein
MAYLDTDCVIYPVERNPAWVSKVIARLTRFRAANDRLAISDLTWAECLVGPFMSGDATVEASYRSFFTDPDIQVLPMTMMICVRAARIRATHKFGLADSLHLATAAEHGCGLFLTSDARLRTCGDIVVEVLR